MPAWHCRHYRPPGLFRKAVAERCEGPDHSECGLLYRKGEFSWDPRGNLYLNGVPGAIPMSGWLPEDPVAVIVRQDAGGWTAEFVDLAEPKERTP